MGSFKIRVELFLIKMPTTGTPTRRHNPSPPTKIRKFVIVHTSTLCSPRKVRPGHEEILLDGTAQSVRNGETLRDDQGDRAISILKKWQILKISSWEGIQQNWNGL